jgi:hypothetical protein
LHLSLSGGNQEGDISIMYYDKAKKPLLGIPLEKPQVTVSWSCTEDDVYSVFQASNVECIAEKYYLITDITFLGNKHCNMGLYFNSTIVKASFSRASYGGYSSFICSYNEFQEAIVNSYGSPTTVKMSDDSFPYCVWNIEKRVNLYHYVLDRFGLEEHLYFEKA